MQLFAVIAVSIFGSGAVREATPDVDAMIKVSGQAIRKPKG